MAKIFLVLVVVSVIVCADLSRNNIGVVNDGTTSLEWQDSYTDNDGVIKMANWKEAIEYCNTLQLDEGEWRLPNLNELLSIVDYGQYDPAINNIFQNSISGVYWSSTTSPYFTNTNGVRNIDFSTGYSTSFAKSRTDYVRCVRNAKLQPSTSSCGDGIVQSPNSDGQFEQCDNNQSWCNNCMMQFHQPAGSCGVAINHTSCGAPMNNVCNSGGFSSATFDATTMQWNWTCGGTSCSTIKDCSYQEVAP